MASYKLVQQMPGGDKLVGITRILHRTKPDVLMDEVRLWLAWPGLAWPGLAWLVACAICARFGARLERTSAVLRPFMLDWYWTFCFHALGLAVWGRWSQPLLRQRYHHHHSSSRQCSYC